MLDSVMKTRLDEPAVALPRGGGEFASIHEDTAGRASRGTPEGGVASSPRYMKTRLDEPAVALLSRRISGIWHLASGMPVAAPPRWAYFLRSSVSSTGSDDRT